MEDNVPFIWIFAVVAALILGLGGGYYYGFVKGESAAKDAIAAEAKKAAEAANPFSQTGSNPLENVTTNPFESVKINPFK